MAWTAPITFTAGSILTVSDLNTYLRDNMRMQAPFIGTTVGDYFVGTAANTIDRRLPVSSRQSAQVTTANTTYTQLGGGTPTVTANPTGTKALVLSSVRLGNTTADSGALASFAISGATTQASDDNRGVNIDGMAAANTTTKDNMCRLGQMDFVSNLTAGSNTFTMEYRVTTSGTGGFEERLLTVLPF